MSLKSLENLLRHLIKDTRRLDSVAVRGKMFLRPRHTYAALSEPQARILRTYRRWTHPEPKPGFRQ